MHFSSSIVRPPFEARSINLQVTSGCSHNKCNYCNYYTNVPYEISPKNEIKEDLIELKNTGYSFKRIWLQGANPFTLPTENLKEIAEMIHYYLPFVESIGCYSRVTDLENKTVDDLQELRRLGYDSIVFGVESGDNKILNKINKGYKSEQIVKQISKMDQAQINYTLIYLNSLGGHNYPLCHAKKTAKVFNKLNPKRVMINQLKIHDNTPLKKDINEGKFIETTPKESIKELITFIESLDINTFLDATNNTNIIPFFGQIQENKENIIKYLKQYKEEKK